MDLVSGWNSIWGAISGGSKLGIILAAVGAAIIVLAVIQWAWQRRKGGGGMSMSGFPWMAVIIGAVLAGPELTIPLILRILQTIITIAVNLGNWIAS